MFESVIVAIVHWYKENNAFSGVRKWVNQLYQNPEVIHIEAKAFDYIVADGCKYYISDQIGSPQRVHDPWFVGVRPTDTILDIGANVGQETIPIAMLVPKGTVYAIEPIFNDLLAKNVSLNDLQNVRIIPCGLGPESTQVEFNHGSHKSIGEIKTFRELKKICGKVDFLWCNCEGGEWDIEPQELEGIREVRFMFHIRSKSAAHDRKCAVRMIDWLNKAGYQITKETSSLWKPNILFKDCYCIKASII
jgi:FkbM family methyltransferase